MCGVERKKFFQASFFFFMCEIEWETKNDLWSPVFFFSWFLFSSVRVWSPVKKQHFFLSRTFFFCEANWKKNTKKKSNEKEDKEI